MAIRIDVDKLKKSVLDTTSIPQCSAEKLSDNHFQEWVNSGIAPEIIHLNVRSLAGQQIIDHLNIGDLNAWALNRRYRDVLKGGWACGSCFKPDIPRQNKNKLVKYENPSGVSPEPILLELTEEMWQAIAAKWNVRKSPDIDGWKWVKANPIIPVATAEGVKKAGCLISQTLIPTIAFTGHSAAYEKDGDLRFSEFIHPDRNIIICFDRDKKYATTKSVSRTIKGAGWRLNPKGKPARAKLSIVRWWSEEKGIDDVWREHGQSEVINLVENAVPWKQWVDTSYSLLGYEPNVKFNSSKWQLIDIPDNVQLVCLKGKKGSGKTWCLEQLTKEAKENGQASIAITHRIQLSEELAKRLGLTYISELDEKVDGAKNITLCIDSLGKINPESFKGGLIIFDEIVQVLEHFLIGETCSHKRQKILKTLKKLMQLIINSGGRIIIADADLNANTINFFVGLMGETEPFIIENTYREQAYDCYLSDGFLAVSGNRVIKTPADIVGVALQKALAGERIFIACTGQKEESKWGSISLEGLFLKHGISSILRADSDTVKEPQHPAFRATSTINALCDQYQVIIATPSLGTGISIENYNKFNLVTGIFTGVGSPDAARQFLMRVRDIGTPRLIYAADRGLNDQFISLGYSEKTVSERTKELREFQENCLTEHDNQWSEEYPEIKYCNSSRVFFDNLIAEKNYQNINFKNSIREGLLSENVNVIDIKIATDMFSCQFDLQNLFDEIGTISAENVEEYRLNLQAQEILGKEEYEKLKGATELSEEERLALEATVLSNKYGGVEVTEKLITKDSEGWYNKIKLFYACTVGYEVQKNIQALVGNSQLKKGDGIIIEHDFVQRQNLLSQAEFVRATEILDFIESEHVFNKTDDESINLYNDMVEQISNINLIFNQQIKSNQYETDKFSFQLILLIADFIGSISLDKGRKRVNKKQVRNYQLTIPDDGRNEIFEAWLIKDKETEMRWFERKKEWEIKKLISICTEDISISDFIKLKESQLFDEVLERVDIRTRTKILNKLEGINFKESEKIFIDALDANAIDNLFKTLKTWTVAAIDSETFGNDKPNKKGETKEGLHKAKGHIRLIQISNADTTYTVDFGNRKSLTRHKALENFKQGFVDLLARKDFTVIGHNLSFDNGFWKHTFNTQAYCTFEDTILGFKTFFGIYNGNNAWDGGFALGTVVEMFLGISMDKTEQKSDWGGILTTAQIEYAARDPHLNFLLWQFLHKLYKNPAKYGFAKLAKWDMMPAWKLENATIEPLNEIELNGLPICEKALRELEQKTETAIKFNLEQWNLLVNANSEISDQFAPTQTAKLVTYLNQKYDLTLKSAEKKVLGDYAALPEVRARSTNSSLQNYKTRLSKLSTSLINYSRAKTFFNPLTGTGRTSSGGKFDDIVNIQSIPAKVDNYLKELQIPSIRSIFKVKKGKVLIIADLAAAHARIAADFANDETGKLAQNDENIDAHSVFALLIAQSMPLKFIEKGLPARFVMHDLDIKIDVEQLRLDYKANKDNFESILSSEGMDKYLLADVTIEDKELLKNFKISTKSVDICNQLRGLAKNIFYAKLNGASAGRIKAELAGQIKITATDTEAKLASDRFDKLYPQLAAYCKEVVQKLNKEENQIWINGQLFGISEIAETGQRLLFNLKVNNEGDIKVPATAVIASQWSRTEATVMKRALALTHALIKKHSEWGAKLVNMVHDEVGVECDEIHAPKVAKMVAWVMAREFKKELKNGVTHGGTDFTNEHKEKYLLDAVGNPILDAKGKKKTDDRFTTSIYSMIGDNWGIK
jgi:DNA polymerase I-like protein with 3'-5' exonuclease and polymerase domains